MSDRSPPPLRELIGDGNDWALFLDFDGTLVALAARPDAIQVPRELPALLRRLERVFDGALAILSGRALRDLDRYLPGLKLPASGQHGVECRFEAHRDATVMDASALEAIRSGIHTFASRIPGLLVEDKGASIALHYRAAPDAEAAVRHQVDVWVAASRGALEYVDGKCLREIHPAGVDKGAALRMFLDEPVFRGRRPLVLGDDVTDEAAFDAAHTLDGAALKVGAGDSHADWRLQSPACARDWLAEVEG
ncbi:MAG: trehalose-phosphatase [Gammaproteobacteria bacterium]|nr:trehalose-phosphatase [Gammaproteobacteria bacterium]